MKNIAMKRMLGIFVLSLLLTSCKSEPKVEKDSYVINGTAPGVVNGVRAYLKNGGQSKARTYPRLSDYYRGKIHF